MQCFKQDFFNPITFKLEDVTMTTDAENAFAFNILMPDLLLFAVAMTAVFGLLLLIFNNNNP